MLVGRRIKETHREGSTAFFRKFPPPPFDTYPKAPRRGAPAGPVITGCRFFLFFFLLSHQAQDPLTPTRIPMLSWRGVLLRQLTWARQIISFQSDMTKIVSALVPKNEHVPARNIAIVSGSSRTPAPTNPASFDVDLKIRKHFFCIRT